MLQFAALPVPDAPVAIYVITVTATTAAVSWVAPPVDPNNLVVFYNLTLREKQFGLPDLHATATTTTYMFTALEEYTDYECSVSSVGIFGTFSVPVSVNFSTLEAGNMYVCILYCIFDLKFLQHPVVLHFLLMVLP